MIWKIKRTFFYALIIKIKNCLNEKSMSGAYWRMRIIEALMYNNRENFHAWLTNLLFFWMKRVWLMLNCQIVKNMLEIIPFVRIIMPRLISTFKYETMCLLAYCYKSWAKTTVIDNKFYSVIYFTLFKKLFFFKTKYKQQKVFGDGLLAESMYIWSIKQLYQLLVFIVKEKVIFEIYFIDYCDKI